MTETEMKQMEDERIDLDDVLMKFNTFGKFHLLSMSMIFLGNLFNGFVTVNYIFAAEEVGYRCNDSDWNNSSCSSNSSITCSEWIYDNPSSFVAEFNLACQDWKRTLIGSVHSFGYMIGLIAVGPLSDRLGRKTMTILTGVGGGLIGFAKSFSGWYWAYVVLEFFEAVFGDIFSPIFMMAVEIVATKKRVTFLTIVTIGYPIGGMVLAFIAWLFPYWRTFLKVAYFPAIIFLSYCFLMVESPRWLLTKGKKDKAVAVLEKAAKMNKIKIDKDLLDKLAEEENKEISVIKLLKSTFASKTLFKRFIICVVWWTTSTFVSFGMLINSVSLQGDKYLNFAILSFIDVPGGFINMYMLKYLKRKVTLILSFFLGAALCIVQPFIPPDITWLSITVYMLGKLMSSFYFDTTYLYTSELFPTYTRNSMHALCSSIGRIGSIIAPQTPLLMMYWTGLPAMIYGIVSLFAGLLTFLVPETSDVSLPDTIKQAESIKSKPIRKDAKSPLSKDTNYVESSNYSSTATIDINIVAQNDNTKL